MPMNVPAFSAIFDHGEQADDITQRYSIIYSTFEVLPGVTEDVNFLWYPGQCIDNPNECYFGTIGSDFMWPRTPGQIPESAFGSNQFIYVGDGFIPPTKQDGAIYVCDVRDPNNTVISDITTSDNNPTDWFYADVLWKDADGDGVLDAFTCRTRTTTIPSAVYSEFLWFKNPGEDEPGSNPWETGLIISENDCDTHYAETSLSVDGETFDVIFTTGYFMNTLSVYWTETGLWNDLDQIQSRVIGSLIDDAQCVPGEGLCGHYFDINILDLDMNGNLDLLVTINSEVYGHLVAYEIPEDFRTDDFVPITLAEGFIPRIGMPNQGAPGLVTTFYPSSSVTGKPWILLTGDDEGTAYYLVPENQTPQDWNYELITIYDGGANFTMGSGISFDSNGDGYEDVFIASYSGNEIQFYTFAP